MRAAHFRPSSRLSALILFCLLAISPLFTVNSDAQVAATPILSLAPGTYTPAQHVSITDTTAGATIYYTLNGTAPAATSTKYTGPITVMATETIQAIAVATGYTQSAPATAAYTILSPELVETAVAVTTTTPTVPLAVSIGGSIPVTDTAGNTGQAASTTTSVTRYYLSATTGKTTTSYLLTGSRTVPALLANVSTTTTATTGSTSAGAATLTVPTGVPHATYYLVACANDTGSVGETNLNNCMAASTQIAVSGPNLIEAAVAVTTTTPTVPFAVSIGGSIPVTDTAGNIGQVSSTTASVTRYYLSTTTGKTTTSYLLTGSRTVPALLANVSTTTTPTTGSTSAGSATATVPTGVPHATYYLVACADDTGTVGETNLNNCMAASTQIAVSGPNLVETAVAVTTTTPTVPFAVSIGGGIPVTDTAGNIGQVSSTTASVTRYYLSTTTGKTTTSYLLTGSRTVPALLANVSTTTTPTTGSTSAGSATATVPTGVPHASYYLVACADDTGTVGETNLNNCMAASTRITVSGPNLVETAVAVTTTTPTVPFAVSIGGGIPVTDTAGNIGQVASTTTSVTRYYLSATTGKTTTSYLLSGSRTVPALLANVSTTTTPTTGSTSAGSATATVPTGVPHATYYLVACADDTGTVGETNLNNCMAASTRIAVSGPNLIETAVAVTTTTPTVPVAVNIGGSFSVTDTAENIGQVASTIPAVTRYYLSTTTGKTTSSYLLSGMRTVPALLANVSTTTTPTAGSTAAGTATVVVPTGVPHASYYLVACADDTGTVGETNLNNCMAASTRITVSGPNLIETAVAVTTTTPTVPFAVNIGGFIPVTDTTENIGQVASTSSSITRYYLSATAAKTTSSYLLSGTRTVPALLANASTTTTPSTGSTSAGSLPVVIPTGVLHATYYLLACADDTGTVGETTLNNCMAASTQIVVSGPDMVETAVSTTTTAVNVGGAISVTDTAENIGPVAIAATGTYYYLSTTASKTTTSYLLTGGRSVPALAATTSSTGTVSTSVPENVLHGSYYLVACANGGAVAETNLNNNCMAASTTIVVSGADFVETAVTAPPSAVNIGSSFSVTDTAQNIGQVASINPSTTSYYLSASTAKTASSYLLGTRTVPVLAVTATSTGTATVSVPTGVPNGSYYLLACANSSNTVDEINTANNCKASSTTTVLGAGLTIYGTSPTGGTVGMPYGYPMSASGGSGIFTWSISAGTLPPGLTLSPGSLLGTPTTPGTYTFTVKVTDTSVPQKTGVASMTITITGLTLTLPNPLSLPAGTTGQPYSAAINALGTITITTTTYNYIWTVNGTSVPTNGMSLTLSNGIAFTNTGGWTLSIGGTPTTPGTVTFNVTVTACTPSASGCVPTSIAAGPVSYSITLNSPTALSLPNPLSLPPGTVGQGYAGAVNAIGGDRLNYTWTVNGTALNINGTPLTLSNGIAFSNTGGYTLSIGGTPNAAGAVSFTASVKDVGTGATAGPVTYSITTNTNNPGSQVGGQIYLNNSCGGNNSGLPPITVSITTNPVQTTTTDSNGNFSFQGVPNGTYTVTPSITGASSVFYPATQSVGVNGTGGNVTFGVALGYTVSGTVDYSGSKTGRIYLALNNNSCGGSSNGTSISAKGSFTIRGVPPGNYTLQAWMDNLGHGQPNASNPAGSTSLTLSSANLSAQLITLSDPPAITLPSAPSLQKVNAFDTGAAIQYQAIQSSNNSSNNNGNSIELATSYTLQWSTSSTFTSIAGSKTFAANGTNGNNVWFIHGLTDGSIYYFRLQGLAGTSTTSPWSSVVGPVTIAAPTGANTVSGTVTFTGTASGPLYAGFYDQSTNNIYATSTAPLTPISPQAFTVKVPTGTNYCFFGIVDQNNDGMIDAGDIQNTNGNCPATAISASMTDKNLTLPSASSSVSLTTQHQRQTNSNGTNDNYQLNFNVSGLLKSPVAVALVSGLNVISPMDIGQCTNCGGNGGFSFWLGLNNATPNVGDAYGIQVTYSDGSSETLTAKVGAVLNAFPANMAPAGSSAAVTTTTPTFTWTDPASASSYIYQFYLWDNNGNTIWQIPGNNSKSNGFSSAVTSIVWGTDPTGGGSTPSVTALTSGVNYNWQIQAQDSNGNSAQMQVSYQPGGQQSLSLPVANPSSLGAATVGQTYNGAINANGGSGGGGYNFTVNGSPVPTNNTPVALADGLTLINSGGNTLFIGGTPTSASTVSFQVSVSDNGTTVGPVTYTITVAAAAPLSFNTTQSDVPVALVNSPYDLYLSVSGGVPPYTFTTASGSVPAPLSYLSADSALAGTPATAGTYTFAVKVTDSASKTVTGPSLTVTVASGPAHQHDAWLKGTYVCRTMGFNDSDSTLWSTLSSFPTTGTSTFTGGLFDMKSLDNGLASGTLSGTVNIGADNTGLLTFTAAPTSGTPNTSTWAVTLNSLAAAPATEFHAVEIDDVGASPSGQHGMADCYQATTSAFATGIGGHSFAFSMGGVNGSGIPNSVVGQFIAGSGGVITGGELDQGKGNNNLQNGTLTGSYTAPSTTSGRYTMSITVSGAGGGTADFVNYIIDAKRQLMLMFDTGDGVNSGNVFTQQQTAYSNANLNGPFVLYLHEHSFDSTTGNVNGFASNLFQGTGNGTTGFTINQSYQDKVNTIGAPGTYTIGNSNGTITVTPAANGRAVFNPSGTGTGDVYLYFYDNNSAVMMDATGNLGLGWIEAQTLPPTITTSTLAGSFEWGPMFPLASFVDDNIGVGTLSSLTSLTSSGTFTGSSTSGGQYEFSWDTLFPSGLTYAWSSTALGTFQVSYSGVPFKSCIVVGAGKSICMNNTSSVAEVEIVQQ